MLEKICSRCKTRKSIENFNKDKHYKDGYNCWCKECVKQYKIIYQEKNKEKIKQYRILHAEKHKKVMKKWHKENTAREKEYRKKYRERENYLSKIRRKKNLNKIREKERNYIRKRRRNELIYMKDRLRNMVSHSFKRKGYSKNTKTCKILGAEYNVVWEYLKITWYNNYGKEYNGEPYEIDHIKPLSLAKTIEEMISLCHYSNLQLLTPEDNMKKSNKII